MQARVCTGLDYSGCCVEEWLDLKYILGVEPPGFCYC